MFVLSWFLRFQQQCQIYDASGPKEVLGDLDRSLLVWLSSGAEPAGCHGPLFQKEQRPVDSGKVYPGMFRPVESRLDPEQHPYRSAPSTTIAESWLHGGLAPAARPAATFLGKTWGGLNLPLEKQIALRT